MKVVLPLLEDAHGIATVHVGAWQQAYSSILPRNFLDSLSIEERAQRWRSILEVRDSTTLVAKSEPGVILGFVSYGRCRDEGAPPDQGEIWSLYVLPAYWGRGVGRLLLGQAMAKLRKAGYGSVTLWVLSNNKLARKFYRAAGFRTIPKSTKPCELGGIEVAEVCMQYRYEAASMDSAVIPDGLPRFRHLPVRIRADW